MTMNDGVPQPGHPCPTTAASQPTSPPTSSGLNFWDRVGAFFRRPEGKVVGFAAAAALVGLGLALSERDRSGPALGPDDEDDTLSPEERLALNREQGAVFEELVGETLVDTYPHAEIVPQVSVATRAGRRRRVDYAIMHRNGSMTPVEAKDVAVLREQHVRQAEDGRDGLRHSHGVRSGLPIVAVPDHTIVTDELAARVRLIRVRTTRAAR